MLIDPDAIEANDCEAARLAGARSDGRTVEVWKAAADYKSSRRVKPRKLRCWRHA